MRPRQAQARREQGVSASSISSQASIARQNRNILPQAALTHQPTKRPWQSQADPQFTTFLPSRNGFVPIESGFLDCRKQLFNDTESRFSIYWKAASVLALGRI